MNEDLIKARSNKPEDDKAAEQHFWPANFQAFTAAQKSQFQLIINAPG